MIPAAKQFSIADERSTLEPVASDRLSVLHVLEATLGGTLRYMENIAESLSTSEYRLGLAFGDSRADSRLTPLLHKVQQDGWSTFHVPMKREIRPADELRALRSLIQVIRTFKPDILHCHSSKAGVIGRLAAKASLHSPRVVYSPHALAIPLGKHYLYIEKALKGLTDQYLAVSESEATQIVGVGLAPRQRVSVSYPMIDSAHFSASASRSQSLAPPQAPTILGVGRLTAQKDPLTFVRIVSQLQEQVPGARGVWVGDGELKDSFLTAVSLATSPEQFELVSWQHDIRPYFDRADALLSTSIYESFGYMVAEALAMQVPVVATSVTGTCDILNGQFAAHMYPPGAEAAAVALLQQIFETPQASRAWSQAAQQMVQSRFSCSAMHDSLSEAYARAADRRPRAALRARKAAL